MIVLIFLSNPESVSHFTYVFITKISLIIKGFILL